MSDIVNFVLAGMVAGIFNAIFSQIGQYIYKEYLEHHVHKVDRAGRRFFRGGLE